jgi:archaellum biogenesis protein FlaJ (TadC family)
MSVMNKFLGIAIGIVGVILGILLVTLLVPPLYANIGAYLPNWTVYTLGGVAYAFPLGGVIQTVVPLILGIVILIAIIVGLFSLLGGSKGGGRRYRRHRR